MATDPWRNRSQGMRCSTCMSFVMKAADESDRPEQAIGAHALGRCRRHAPTMSGYPVVFTNDWCGDHKLNENAL